MSKLILCCSIIIILFVIGIPTTKCVSSNNDNSNEISIAFIGNSVLYYNDCPRLLEQLFKHDGYYDKVTQDSTLRSAGTITTLWEKGNGMEDKFTTNDIGASTVKELLTENYWDYVIINDRTLWPAIKEKRLESIDTLQTYIVPLIIRKNNKRSAVPIIIETYAYRRRNIADSESMGSFNEFTDSILNGIKDYKEAIDDELQNVWNVATESRTAPVGEAFRYVRNYDRNLFDKLYSWDDVHPSPYGTWLQACVLYCTIRPNKRPPRYRNSYWDNSRYFMPLQDDNDDTVAEVESIPFPSSDEANTLRNIAIEICDQYN